MGVVLVTGSARGIGLATAVHLSYKGWEVVGVDREPPEDTAPFSLFIDQDLTETDAPARIVARTMNKLGPLDGLVNNAVAVWTGPFLDADVSDVDRSLAVNARALFMITQAVARSMVDAHTQGSIVNVASVNAERGVRKTSIYSATKGFVAALTRCLAVELAEHHIRVNAVAPSTVDTKRVMATIPPDMREERLRQIPMGRFARPEEIARGIEFLLDPNSAFVTGIVLPIDGGYLSFGS
jgi:NAD(P)-dependent dehydrogenase (short-subunit alcohol dehydrogenase family)